MADNEQAKSNLLQKVIEELIDQLDWVRDVLSNENIRNAIEENLGLEPGTLKALPPEPATITKYRKDAGKGDKLDKQASLETLTDIIKVSDSIAAMVEAASDGGEEAARELAHSLLSLLLTGWVRQRYPLLHKIGSLLGFIEEAGSTNLSEKVYFDRVPDLLTDTCGYFKRLFGSLDTEQDAKRLSDTFFPAVAGVLAILGNKEEEKGTVRNFPDFFATKNVIYGWDAAPGSRTQVADEISDRALSMAFEYRKEDSAAGGAVEGELDLTLLFVPRSDGGPGLFVSLGGAVEIEGRINRDWRLKLESRTTDALDFLIGANMDTNSSVDASARITVEPVPIISGQQQARGQKYVFPDPKGMRVEFGRLSLTGEISGQGAGFELTAEDGAFVLSSDECDNFIADVLPGQKVPSAKEGHPHAKETHIGFNLGLGLSSERGFYLTGGSGLQALVPIGKSIGPATIQQLVLKLTPSTDTKPSQLVGEVSAGLSIRLRDVTVTVEQIGLRVLVPFGRNDKGKWDFSVGVKPPNGIGLAIDADVVKGGGFLSFDATTGQYAGAAFLEFSGGLAVKALGLLNTRLPEDARGYSLVLIITAEGFRPLPLGFGFMLTGIGGLLGIHRTVREEALREGVHNQTLDAILFPRDPVRNAARYFSTLREVFPPARDHYLFGLMARITWGPGKPLLDINLALAAEFGVRHRFIVAAQLRSDLPDKETGLVRLRMDAVGIVDFDKKKASLDASLHDSWLAGMCEIHGEMAMRMSWGEQADFVLSVGGFHQRYMPPDGFPKLQPALISLADSDNLRVQLNAYFAITSNTVQFGADIDIQAGFAGISIEGGAGFHALIQFDPFYFVADAYGYVKIKFRRWTLMSVELNGEISGPRPLRIRGTVKFSILWWDKTKSFDYTLVKGDKPPLPVPVEVRPLLLEALRNPANWAAVPASGISALVTVREPDVSGEIHIHPLSALRVRQTVVPLNTPLARYGAARPAGENQFRISRVRIGTQPASGLKPLQDAFAPSQFRDMTEDEKFSAPAYVSLDSGVSFGDLAPTAGEAVTAETGYERVILTPQRRQKEEGSRWTTDEHVWSRWLPQSAAGRAAGQARGRKYEVEPMGLDRLPDGKKEEYETVSNEDGGGRTLPGAGGSRHGTWLEAHDAWRRLRREDPARAADIRIVKRKES